jgi:hypothetical protein
MNFTIAFESPWVKFTVVSSFSDSLLHTLSYSTPPPSASHRIYGHVHCKPLAFQTFQTTFIDSPWPTLVYHLTSIPIDLVTKLNLVLASTASELLHTCQTNCLITCSLVCCYVSCLHHASSLSPRWASIILAKIYWVANAYHLKPHYR